MPPEPQPFLAADLLRFLSAVDANLTSPASLVVLGGSAIALYGVAAGTIDIDCWETDLAPLQAAFQRARVQTGLDIPVNPTGVADVPDNWRDRRERERADWRNLRVFKLEPHDLALSKAVRGNEHDLAAIEKLHRIVHLDPEVLTSRYLEEMTHVIGDPVRRDMNFAAMFDRLFGEVEAERVYQILRSRSRAE